MKQQNSKSEHRFLVLMDFSEASYLALKYTISLAKLLGGKIHVWHASNPMELVDSENPLKVIDAIESETKKIKRKLISIKEIIAAEGIDASSHLALGNTINDFEDQVECIKPNLVIIGKKMAKPKFFGKITSYLLNNYSGSLLMVGEESEFQTDAKISLGCNGNTLNNSNPEMIFSLNKHTESPLTLVEVKNTNDSSKQMSLPNGWKSLYEIDRNIQFESQNESVVANGLFDYVSKNNINLLCIGRGKRKGMLQRLFSNQSTISEVVNKVNIPILVMGTNSESVVSETSKG